MGRRPRNREWDIAMGVAQLIAIVILVMVFLPSVRQRLFTLGVYLIGVVVLAGVVALGVFLIRRSERKSTLDSMPFATLETPPQSQATKQEDKPPAIPDLVGQLRTIDWFQFEKLVALAYRKLGYNVTRRGGANPDGGIDLVIEKSGHRSAVQCKQWKTWNVGVKAVREFLGALTDAGIPKGVFITLCGYTAEAKQLAEKHGIEIINETGLARMLELTDARFDPETLGILRDTRKFCPKCESLMVLRTAGKGPSAGKQFWGCSTYPRCHFKMPTA